jgi:hypothetical protein
VHLLLFSIADCASVTYAGCRAYNREREAAAERRRAAEADAYARSRKILEEELARDRAWRDAVKQVNISKWDLAQVSIGQ